MKKITIILMAWALVMTMSQCKKQIENAEMEDTVNITLKVRSDDGTKAVVNPTIGSVEYETGDKIHVVSGGKYVGTLKYEDGQFTGPISNAVVNEKLHFFYFGNVDPTVELVSGQTTSCMIDISNQVENQQDGGWHLPVISYAPSDEDYSSTTEVYNAYLRNKCALAKFVVTTVSTRDIIITGLNHQVSIDFTQTPPTFTYGRYAEGHINIGKGEVDSFEKWIILLPQDALEVGEEGSAYDATNSYIGVRGAIPAISTNGFLTSGIPVTVTQVNGDNAPTGAINGKFSISGDNNANNNKVYFSRGNLQYIGSAATPYWQFAEHQWDYIGHNASQGEDYDLIDWNTAMESHTISNGGDQSWRMLTQNQLIYILNTRQTASGIRYAKAVLNGVCGLLLLPDDWRSSIYALQNYNSTSANFSSNVIDANTSALLQANGVVFLPVGGTSGGRYWTSTQQTISGNIFASSLQILNNNQNINPISPTSTCYVRLVQDIP